MLPEEGERTPERRLGRRFVIARLLRIEEGVLSAGIDVERDIGMGGADSFHIRHRHDAVLITVMHHGRALRRAVKMVRHLAAVEDHRRIDIEGGGGNPDAYQLGDSTIDREIILWPAKLVIPIAFAVLTARLLIQLLAYTRLALHPEAEPVAIPVIEKFEETAQHEIEGALGTAGSDEADKGAPR